jgi:hypothetical protein
VGEIVRTSAQAGASKANDASIAARARNIFMIEFPGAVVIASLQGM